MTNLALITGASSGIGREFARIHAQRAGDMIIVARRKDELDALKAELETAHGVSVQVIAADLTDAAAVQNLCDSLRGQPIEVLINNAGFGGQGSHVDRDLGKELSMIDLNVKALVTLCHDIGGQMAKRGAGRILNVGSTAGMMPGPMQNVYFATKAFVRSYSLALAEELRASGVTVTVLAPGYVETEFADTADLRGTALVKGGGKTPHSVAAFGYDSMVAGKLHVINEGLLSFALNWIIPLMPHRLVLGIARRMQTKA
ncbi:SDR family NAD(P)-dependent oxidoreductase [Loktanella salsilacus]|jgi:short-subunit dehydrogenase|uniref:SDR family NAD(P)-dependent oxidoreductase n=1 Tax=Loktanella salsilacus TaxID=195913 RepID=UPI0035615384|nr:SDR family oxidoreductase [Alphaproteobacteria bacterium]MBU1836141.1 SDR family oxidoreductase [Alphaproteobacteria bacterium]